MKETVLAYIKKEYKSSPEYLWKKYPDYAVFRHSDNNKWFALVAPVSGDRLGLDSAELIDIINVKVDDMLFRDTLIQQPGIFPAYHMNKLHWVTVLLDGSVPEKQVLDLLDASFMATASAKEKQKKRPPKEWIIPSNPKYYDIIHAFDTTDEIDWKQGTGIKPGDTVFLYVGSPVSAILYKCKVTETDIPYRYRDENLTITALMKIKLLKRYKPEEFTFDVLKKEYDIYAVRGPRGIPDSLSAALER